MAGRGFESHRRLQQAAAASDGVAQKVGEIVASSVYDPRPSMATVVRQDAAMDDNESSRRDAPDERQADQPLGLLALLRPRRRREWCCDACRQAAEPPHQTW